MDGLDYASATDRQAPLAARALHDSHHGSPPRQHKDACLAYWLRRVDLTHSHKAFKLLVWHYFGGCV